MQRAHHCSKVKPASDVKNPGQEQVGAGIGPGEEAQATADGQLPVPL